MIAKLQGKNNFSFLLLVGKNPARLIPLPAATHQNMKTNFESAITAAIETVASLLNEPIEKIAAEALNDGPIRDSVMILAVHAGTN